MPDQICFPDHTGVPGQYDPPTVDGFVEPEPAMSYDFGTAVSKVDTGWTGAGRETFGNATAVGLSAPLVSFQGVKHNSLGFMYLSFVVRRDPSFDDRDRVILVLHPDFATGSQNKTGQERRIDIEPVNSGAGAGTAAPDEADPWGLTVGNAGFKTNRPERNVECYRWDTTSDAWTPVAKPTGLDIRVRSWDGGTNNRNWSMEVRVPTTTATGGAGWIDLTANPGLFFDVVRVVAGTPVGLDFVTQFVWPAGGELDDNGGLLDLDEIVIEPAKLGSVVLGSGPACTGVRGVSFDGGYGAIGVRPAGSTATPGSSIARTANQFVAQVRNDDVTRAAAGVTAEFRIANWGVGPAVFGRWNKIPADAGHTNPSAAITLAVAVTQPNGSITASTGQLTTQWTPGAGEYGTTLRLHQCVWVRLDSSQSVSFVRSSGVANMELVKLSEHSRDAEVSGVGWPHSGGGDLQFILLTSTIAVSRRLDRERPNGDIIDESGGAGAPTPAVDVRRGEERNEQVFVTVVDGYRRTGRTLTIRGQRLPVYAYADSFGHTGVHRAVSLDNVEIVLDGPTLTAAGPGGYLITVPVDGSARLTTRLRTRPADAAAQLGWLIQLLRRVWAALRAIWKAVRRLFGAGG